MSSDEMTRDERGTSDTELVIYDLDTLIDIQRYKCLRALTIDITDKRPLDISPVTSCKDLREIRIIYTPFDTWGNRTIDLSPLVKCSNLDTVIIGGDITNLDITPLYFCKRLKIFRLTASKEPFLSCPIFFDHAPWIDYMTTSSKSPSIKDVCDRFGVGETMELIKTCLSRHKDIFYHINRTVLECLDMAEMIGIDTHIYDVFDGLPDADFETVRDVIYNRLVDIAREQVRRGGPSMLFDIEKMKHTAAAVLIPDILEQRAHEDMYVYLTPREVDLTPLWYTGWGYTVLKSIKAPRFISMDKLQELLYVFERTNLNVQVRRAPYLPENMSEGLIDSIIGHTSIHSRKEEQWRYDSFSSHEREKFGIRIGK